MNGHVFETHAKKIQEKKIKMKKPPDPVKTTVKDDKWKIIKTISTFDKILF